MSIWLAFYLGGAIAGALTSLLASGDWTDSPWGDIAAAAFTSGVLWPVMGPVLLVAVILDRRKRAARRPSSERGSGA